MFMFACKHCDSVFTAEEWNKKNPDPYLKFPEYFDAGEFFCPGCDEFNKVGEIRPF